jgi:hypothetical protein
MDQAKEKLTLPEKYRNLNYQFFVIPNVENMYKERKGTKSAK